MYDDDLKVVKAWLESMYGDWDLILPKADVSKRTLTKIMNVPDYHPTKRTIRKLLAAKKKIERSAQ